MRLLCYIMETDYTEALTPICISLTNLAERQLHTKDVEANATGKGRHGGQHPWAGRWGWAAGPLHALGPSHFSGEHCRVQAARLKAALAM